MPENLRFGMTAHEAWIWAERHRVVVSFAEPGKVKVMSGSHGGFEVSGPKLLDAVIEARLELERREAARLTPPPTAP